MRAFAVVCLLGMGLAFSGCTSKEPMDYLPECQAYLGMNLQQTRSEPGARRLSDVMNKVQPQRSAISDKVTHFYIGVSEVSSSSPSFYSVMFGSPGVADSIFAELKKAGCTETKIDGKKALNASNGKEVYIQLSDKAVLFTDSTSSYETMASTAKKKNPSAANSPVFKKLNELFASHAVVGAMNPQSLISQAGPQLNMLAMMNPKAPEAIKQIQLVTLTADWDQQPTVEVAVSVPDEQGRKALSGLAFMALQQVRKQVGPMAGSLPSMETKQSSDGVQISAKASQQASDQFLTQLEQMVAKLPEDPKQRQQALQMFMAQMGASMAGQGGAAGAPGAFPGAAATGTGQGANHGRGALIGAEVGTASAAAAAAGGQPTPASAPGADSVPAASATPVSLAATPAIAAQPAADSSNPANSFTPARTTFTPFGGRYAPTPPPTATPAATYAAPVATYAATPAPTPVATPVATPSPTRVRSLAPQSNN